MSSLTIEEQLTELRQKETTLLNWLGKPDLSPQVANGLEEALRRVRADQRLLQLRLVQMEKGPT